MPSALTNERIEHAVAAVFAAGARGWEPHDALVDALARTLALPPREVERQLDRLASGGWLDAITICHCPPGAARMVVESGWQPGLRLAGATAQPA